MDAWPLHQPQDVFQMTIIIVMFFLYGYPPTLAQLTYTFQSARTQFLDPNIITHAQNDFWCAQYHNLIPLNCKAMQHSKVVTEHWPSVWCIWWFYSVSQSINVPKLCFQKLMSTLVKIIEMAIFGNIEWTPAIRSMT